MPRHLFTITSIFLVSSLFLASCEAFMPQYKCTDPLGCLEISPGSPLVIGVIYAQDGKYASLGKDSLLGVELAVQDKGSILGHPIKLVRYGTDCTEESARIAATAFATQPDLLAVIGPTCTDEPESAARVLTDAGILLLSPSPNSTATYSSSQSLLSAIEQVAVQRGDVLFIPRLALRNMLALIRARSDEMVFLKKFVPSVDV